MLWSAMETENIPRYSVETEKVVKLRNSNKSETLEEKKKIFGFFFGASCWFSFIS